MSDKHEHIASLIMMDVFEMIDGSGLRELEEWSSTSPHNRSVLDSFRSKEQLTKMLSDYANADTQAAWEKLRGRIPELAAPQHISLVALLHSLFSGKPGARRFRLALALILLLSIPVAIWDFRSHAPVHGMATTTLGNRQFPAGSGHSGKEMQSLKATTFIRFDDGNPVDLDSIRNGQLIRRVDNTDWIKTDSATISGLTTTGNATGISSFIGLYTTRGRMSRLILPDGSQVQLNAATSLRFASSFASGSRHIDLEGDAYFEVAHMDRDIPFIVSATAYPGAAPITIQAHGTSFDVQANPGDAAIKATLVKGSINIAWGNGFATPLQKSGQQFQLYPDGRHTIARADLQTVLAWKDNTFSFDNAALPDILGELTRWYNKEFVIKDPIREQFSIKGQPRSRSLSKILDGLQGINYFEWKEVRDKIIITRGSDTMTH